MATDLQTFENDEPPRSSNLSVMNPYGQAPAINSEANAMVAAAEQRAIAEVQASLVMAQRFPRDPRLCVDRIITSFARKSLAEKAVYQYSRGGTDITGPSIRAAEAIAQQWGNFEFGFRELSRMRGAGNVSVSQVQAFAIDLEMRTRRTIEFMVRHWRDTRSGGYPLKDERDIYELISNQAQRRVRACILALIPGDVVETAIEQAETTLKNTADVTPEGIKAMLARFEPMGIEASHIEGRIQRRIDAITAAQIVDLRRVYNSLRDGMSKPSDWFQIVDPDPDTPPAAADMNARLAAASKAKASKAESKPAKSETQSQKDTAAPPVLSFAQVADAMQNATDRDAFDTAFDSIGLVANADHRAELVELSKTKSNEKGFTR